MTAQRQPEDGERSTLASVYRIKGQRIRSSWINNARNQVQRLCALEDGWSGGKDDEIHEIRATHFLRVLSILASQGVRQPLLYPTAQGGLVSEWICDRQLSTGNVSHRLQSRSATSPVVLAPRSYISWELHRSGSHAITVLRQHAPMAYSVFQSSFDPIISDSRIASTIRQYLAT